MATEIDERALAEVNKFRKQLFNMVNHLHEHLEMDEIYHYTSAEGLQGIMQTGELWFTRWDYLNDSSEFKYIHEIIENNAKIYKQDKDFVRLIDSINKQIVGLKESRYWNDERTDIYFASFSEHSDALNMWSRYTKSSSTLGYSLGFESKGLFTNRKLDLAASRIIYDIDEQNEITQKMLELLYRMYQNIQSSDILKRDESYIMGTSIDDVLSEIGYIFKHPAYSDEKEIRLALRHHPYDDQYEKLNKHTRISNGYFIPYIPLNFEKQLLTSVTISPALNPDIAMRGVATARNLYGYSFSINSSSIPYRNI